MIVQNKVLKKMDFKQLLIFTIYLFVVFVFVIEARQQMNSFRKWRFNDLFDNNAINDDPPNPNKYAEMARYIIHYSDYVSIATISTEDEIKSYPFVSLISMSDGPIEKGTGIPYMYTTSLDGSAKDLQQDNRSTLMASLVQGGYCKEKNYDPEDPRCAHVMLTGKIVKLINGTEEYNFAKSSLFSRHPIMKKWPNDHHFFFIKLDIGSILLQDYFGGPKHIDIKDYLSVKNKNSNSILHDDNDMNINLNFFVENV